MKRRGGGRGSEDESEARRGEKDDGDQKRKRIG